MMNINGWYTEALTLINKGKFPKSFWKEAAYPRAKLIILFYETGILEMPRLETLSGKIKRNLQQFPVVYL